MKRVRYHVLDVESGDGWAVVMLFDRVTDRYVVASDYPKGRNRDESGTRTRAELDFKRRVGHLSDGGGNGRLSA